MNSNEIEIAVCNYFGLRRNLIVPNVWWGMNFKHELDMLVISRAGYASEVEIKTTKGDLKKDLAKKHGHADHRIKSLWFAIPESLIHCTDLVPEHAGIMICGMKKIGDNRPMVPKVIKVLRRPKSKSQYEWNALEQLKLAQLGCLRVWNLKAKVIGQKIEDDEVSDELSRAVP